jgi:hypothetical protein
MAYGQLTARPHQLLAPQGPLLGLRPGAAAMSAITAAIPQELGALAPLEWLRSHDARVHRGWLWAEVMVALVALVFALVFSLVFSAALSLALSLVSMAFGHRAPRSGEGGYVIWGLSLGAGAAGQVAAGVYLAGRAPMSADQEL